MAAVGRQVKFRIGYRLELDAFISCSFNFSSKLATDLGERNSGGRAFCKVLGTGGCQGPWA